MSIRLAERIRRLLVLTRHREKITIFRRDLHCKVGQVYGVSVH